jgi:hypothetical protein
MAQYFRRYLEEGESDILRAVMREGTGEGDAVALDDVSTITLTIRDTSYTSGSIVNSRNAVNVKNANGGTYHATTGVFTFAFAVADFTSAAAAARVPHYATCTATLTDGQVRYLRGELWVKQGS